MIGSTGALYFMEKDKIKELEQEIERLNNIIEETRNYVDKMSYADIVDNPKKDLVKILKKEN